MKTGFTLYPHQGTRSLPAAQTTVHSTSGILELLYHLCACLNMSALFNTLGNLWLGYMFICRATGIVR